MDLFPYRLFFVAHYISGNISEELYQPSSERKGDRLRWKEPARINEFYISTKKRYASHFALTPSVRYASSSLAEGAFDSLTLYVNFLFIFRLLAIVFTDFRF